MNKTEKIDVGNEMEIWETSPGMYTIGADDGFVLVPGKLNTIHLPSDLQGTIFVSYYPFDSENKTIEKFAKISTHDKSVVIISKEEVPDNIVLIDVGELFK